MNFCLPEMSISCWNECQKSEIIFTFFLVNDTLNFHSLVSVRISWFMLSMDAFTNIFTKGVLLDLM